MIIQNQRHCAVTAPEADEACCAEGGWGRGLRGGEWDPTFALTHRAVGSQQPCLTDENLGVSGL